MREWQALAAMTTSKYSAADYTFQFITVTAGVLIALLINGLVDWNSNRELVAQARATIAQEISDNKKELDATMSGFDRDKQALEQAIKFASDMLKVHKTNITSIELHYNMADLLSTGWHTAERTGALSHMDYSQVQKYSKVYDFQDLFLQQQRAILSQIAIASALIQGDFDPDNPNTKDLENFRERVMQLRGFMEIQQDFAKKLAERYAELLKQ
jgi:hypothetical protein